MSEKNAVEDGRSTEELTELVLEVAARFTTATMSADNVCGILPDEAVDLATDMVAYAVSARTAARLQLRIADPKSVAKSIDDQMANILKRVAAQQSDTIQREALAYAKAFRDR